MSPVPSHCGQLPINGSIVALPTPFGDGGLHLTDLDDLIAFQARHTTTGVLVGGTVGEGWALSVEETGRVVGRAAEAAALHSKFRIHVYAGVSEVDSSRARDVAITAVHAGAEAIFITAPPLVDAGDDGLLRHLAFVAEGLPLNLPLILVNEVKRTGFDITPKLVRRALEEIPSIVAHCEGIGRPARAKSLVKSLPIPVLCSDDRMIGPYARSGAVGAVSTVANIVPGEVARLLSLAGSPKEKDVAAADAIERGISPLVDALRIAGSPVPLKEALFAMEAIGANEVRSPLCPLDHKNSQALARSLSTARLLVPAAG